jgi:CheY-like chemotaxis protein
MQGRRSILIVGSNPQNMRSLSLLLQRFGYDVTTADNAGQALADLPDVRPSLVITDLALADMSGMDFFRQLVQNRVAASTPVVFTVPPSDAAAESRCLDHGAVACITKPVQAEELFRVVQAVIEPRPRANIRIDVRLPVSVNNVPVICPEGGCLIDLSEQGMHLPMNKPYPSKGRIAVQLQIKDRTIFAEGTIQYSHAAGSGRHQEPGIGLKFIQIAPQDQDFIRKFIREEVTRDLTTALSCRR